MELSLVSSESLKKVSVALAKHADLEEMRIVSSSIFRVTPGTYSQWTTECRTLSIKKLTLDDFYFRIPTTFTSSLSTPVPSLCIHGSLLDIATIQKIIPTSPISLRTLKRLSISSHCKFSSAELDRLFQHIGFTVSHFSLAIEDALSYDKLTIEGYLSGQSANGSVLPSFVFSPFPQIRSLSLQNCQGMTLEKLKVIGNDSPHLIELDLKGTFWSISSATVDDWEAGFISVLDNHFPRLKEMHAGVLPYLEGLFRNGLENAMRDKGVSFSWSGCESRFIEEYRIQMTSYGSGAPSPGGYY